jgi:hypothetical protein
VPRDPLRHQPHPCAHRRAHDGIYK